jgi:radical SAM protein (TIGR01212 family)
VHHYNSYRQFIKEKFGAPVYKAPLSGGFSCPNRDGKKSVAGCRFCDNRSFSPASLRLEDPLGQLLKTIRTHSHRYSMFIPYLQPFSNTYGTVERLKEVYEPLLSINGVVGIAIGTRPDCFSEEIYEYLADLNKRTYLSVELGLQSSHNLTLDKINRGHTVEDFTETVNHLNSIGIETVAHVLLGLPGESYEMMIQTAQYLAAIPVRGIKIHQLMIIKGTAFEELFYKEELPLFEIQTYGELLCDFLAYLRPDQLLHRIMADSKPEFGLIGPMWSAEKNKSLSVIQGIMDSKDCRQGSKYNIVN